MRAVPTATAPLPVKTADPWTVFLESPTPVNGFAIPRSLRIAEACPQRNLEGMVTETLSQRAFPGAEVGTGF